MELINILYLQDVDLGIGREAFNDLCSDTSPSPAVDHKQCQSVNHQVSFIVQCCLHVVSLLRIEMLIYCF